MSEKLTSTQEWTFLSNHGHVLVQVSRDGEARIRDIAAVVGVTERRVQAILSDLVEGGYLSITRVGRRNVYRINTHLHFRHPAEEGQPISTLLKIFSK